MKLRLVSPGKTKSPFCRAGEAFYSQKIAHYAPLDITFVKDEPLHEGKNERQVVALESARLVQALATDRSYVVLLDRTGRFLTSEELARLVQKTAAGGAREMAFVIGGVLGFSEELKAKANCVLSLSAMTFTHELSRVILLEQLYRALTILKGGKYHK